MDAEEPIVETTQTNNEIVDSYKEKIREDLERLVATWPEFKAKLQGQVYSFAKMQDMFRRAGAPYETEHIGVKREQIRDMFPIVQLMRYRYNLLDLAKRGQFYDAIVDPIFAAGGAWEC
jgi:glycerol-1-phosphate dehydrogenase [NAD(P)+]